MSIDTEPVSGEKVGDDDNTIAIIDPDVELPDEPALPKLRADDGMLTPVLPPAVLMRGFCGCLASLPSG